MSTPPRPIRLTPDEQAARNRRNVALALGLVAFIVVVFTVTVLRLSANIAASAGG